MKSSAELSSIISTIEEIDPNSEVLWDLQGQLRQSLAFESYAWKVSKEIGGLATVAGIQILLFKLMDDGWTPPEGLLG